MIIRLSQFNCNCNCLLELSLAIAEKIELFSSWTFFLQFFWFIWNQMCYCHGRPLILKLIPNHEECNNTISWFNWNWQRNFSLKFNVAIFKTEIYVKLQTGTKLLYWVMQSMCIKMELSLTLKIVNLKRLDQNSLNWER